MRHGLALVTPPAVEPLSTAEGKTHLRIDHDLEDSHIDELIEGARQEVETMTRRSLITTEWRLTFDWFPAVIELPQPPLQTVDSIIYTDTDGVEQTLATSLYQVDVDREPGRIIPAPNTTWPTTQIDRLNAVKVAFTAGYGAASTDVPQALRHAIRLFLSQMYGVREPVLVGAGAREVPLGVMDLVRQYTWGSYPS